MVWFLSGSAARPTAPSAAGEEADEGRGSPSTSSSSTGSLSTIGSFVASVYAATLAPALASSEESETAPSSTGTASEAESEGRATAAGTTLSRPVDGDTDSMLGHREDSARATPVVASSGSSSSNNNNRDAAAVSGLAALASLQASREERRPRSYMSRVHASDSENDDRTGDVDSDFDGTALLGIPRAHRRGPVRSRTSTRQHSPDGRDLILRLETSRNRIPPNPAPRSAEAAAAASSNEDESEDSSMDRKPAALNESNGHGQGGDGKGNGPNDGDGDGDSHGDRKPAAKVTVPPSTSERRVWLDALRGSRATHCDSHAFWTSLPPKYRTDKEFVLTALRHFAVLPDKSSFERTFPQTLRFDRDVVLAFCARPDFTSLFEERHLYPPHCLTSDKDVMLAYCKEIPRSLQECSEELADDPDVVRAAIRLDGLELQYASRRLQDDIETVKAACERDGRALEFCPPGPLRTQLCQDRQFMLKVMGNKGGALWRMASPELQEDRELLRVALATGLRLRFCPPHLRSETDFLCALLELNSSLYLEMSKSEQAQQDIAVAAITSPTSLPEVHERALQLVPSILTNREVVLAVAKRGNAAVVTKIFQGANEQTQDDKEVALAVLSKNVALFSNVSARLKRDNDILVAAMDANTALGILKTIGPSVQEECPQIPEHAIKVASSGSLRELRRYVQPTSLWSEKRIAMAWVQRGKACMTSFEPFYGDADFALAVAQHVPMDFARISSQLRSSKAFMYQALTLNGRVLRYAGVALQSDYDLVVRAVATSADALWPACPIKADQLLTHLNEKLQLHHTFVMDFLRGIAISDSQRLAPSRRSALPLLDRGVETSQAFKRLIAEMLGVPLGEALAAIRLAHRNLSDPSRAAAAATATAAEATNDIGEDPWMFEGPAGDRLRARRAILFQRMFDVAEGELPAGDGPAPAAAAVRRIEHGRRRPRLLLARQRNPAALEDPDLFRWLDGAERAARGPALRERPDPANPMAPAAREGDDALAEPRVRWWDRQVPRRAAEPFVARRLRRDPFLARPLRRVAPEGEDDEAAPVADLRRAHIADVAGEVEDDDFIEEIFMEDLIMAEEDMLFAAMEAHDPVNLGIDNF